MKEEMKKTAATPECTPDVGDAVIAPDTDRLIDAVAERVLTTYIEAFKELAK